MTHFTIDQQSASLSPEGRATLQLIVHLGQQHLVEHWPPPGEATHDKQRLLEQFRNLDRRYPGGLERYLQHAAKLLDESKRGDSPYRDYVAQVPEGLAVEFATTEYMQLESIGLKEANRCAFVLVAGGLGERLGSPGIKVALPAETATGRSFIEHFATQILAMQRCSNHCLGENRQPPLTIMTSDDTHAETTKLLENNCHFNWSPEHVTLLKQDRVACIADPTLRLATSSNDPYELMTKPHGHGDVHALLHRSGLVRRWLDEGLRWVLFFQDSNGLALNVALAALGASNKAGLDVNSIVVPRYPGEAVGGLVRLVKPGESLTVNVEYNQLDSLLCNTPGGAGDVPDRSGYSPYPGNTNIFILSLAPYAKTLERTGGEVPEFVNPKYADESRTSFRSPTRLECMMQDYPRLAPEARVGFTRFERSVCFSPVKNRLEIAAARQAEQPPLPAEGAATGEADQYALYRRILRLAGAVIEDGKAESHCGVTATIFPIVVLAHELTIPVGSLAHKLTEVRVSARSTLLIFATSIEIHGLDLDGALEIYAVPGARIVIQNLVIRNRGWKSRSVDAASAVPPEVAIRGFTLDRCESLVIEAKQPGDYLVNPAKLAEGTVDATDAGRYLVIL